MSDDNISFECSTPYRRPDGSLYNQISLDMMYSLKQLFPKLEVSNESPTTSKDSKGNVFKTFTFSFKPLEDEPYRFTNDMAKIIFSRYAHLEDVPCELVWRAPPEIFKYVGEKPEGHSQYRHTVYMRLTIRAKE